jgi:copper chaperone for superoxide dismutase
MIPDFETTFAVPLSCEACIKSVSTSLYKLDGKLGGLFQHP